MIVNFKVFTGNHAAGTIIDGKILEPALVTYTLFPIFAVLFGAT